MRKLTIAIGTTILFILLHFSVNLHAQSSTVGLILQDTFNDLTPFVRENGYHEITLTPCFGPPGALRYWHPGSYINGATVASHIGITTEGKVNNGVSFNYSGSFNGGCTQDVIAYPVGDLMNPEEGAIEFWYKPHFNQNDGSAIIYVIGGNKKRIDDPDNVYQELEAADRCSLMLNYGGWHGRHRWTASLGERNTSDTGYNFFIYARTPDQYNPGRIYFDTEKWLHFGITWKHDGMDTYDNKTLVLFINGQEVASTTAPFSPQHPFNDYLVIGGMAGIHWFPTGSMKAYSGASGDIDNLKIWDCAKTDFFPIEVAIDIKPGSDPNSINLKSRGVIPVAVLTTEDFDTSDVDPETVLFANAAPVRWSMEDVDSDGDMDLLFHLKTQGLDLTDESTEATLTGSTYEGFPVQGTDSVNVVPL